MKAKKLIAITVTSIAVLMVVLSGVLKFAGSKDMVKTLTQVGVAEHIKLLGLMEITFAILFVYPKTMKLGFILLSCYFAGALATEMSHGIAFNAFIPIVLVWISAFLRDRSIFLPDDAGVKYQ